MSGLTLLVLLTNGVTNVSAILLFLNALLLFSFSYLMLRAKRKSARLFDASGITRGDGRHFPWNEFRGVITRRDINLRTRRKYVWRIELVFAGDEAAWIIPRRIMNSAEVLDYVAALPRAYPKTGG